MSSPRRYPRWSRSRSLPTNTSRVAPAIVEWPVHSPSSSIAPHPSSRDFNTMRCSSHFWTASRIHSLEYVSRSSSAWSSTAHRRVAMMAPWHLMTASWSSPRVHSLTVLFVGSNAASQFASPIKRFSVVESSSSRAGTWVMDSLLGRLNPPAWPGFVFKVRPTNWATFRRPAAGVAWPHGRGRGGRRCTGRSPSPRRSLGWAVRSGPC